MKRTYEVVEENGVKSYRLDDIPLYAALFEELKEGLYLESVGESEKEKAAAARLVKAKSRPKKG